jgi:glycosyltransferase involved in cell wall biosynthesis
MAVKRIYLEPGGRLHSYLKGLARHPPEGYEFVIPKTVYDQALAPLWNIYFVYHTLNVYFLNRIIPSQLLKAKLEVYLRKPPPGIALTYSSGHLVFRKEPWILEIEYVTQLTGFRPDHLRRFQGLVERTLGSAYCRKILCWSCFTQQGLLSFLDCFSFSDKIEVVYHAIPPKTFTKAYNTEKVKLLFVGSANFANEFEVKGGKEVLEAYSVLRQRFNHIELTMRSDVPDHRKAKYQGLPGLRFIEKIIPYEQLEEEFKTADIFILPAHNTPFMVYLEAMSYELPVITTDLYANPEYVADGRTGLLVRPFDKRRYHIDYSLPPELSTRAFKAVRDLYPEVVQDLVDKTSLLIDNPTLRRQMGKAGRWEIEHGKFSIRRRNEQLKRIFDEAIGTR